MADNMNEGRNRQVPGDINAGDARASLYRNEEDQPAPVPTHPLQPGADADELREAAHGDPDLDHDLAADGTADE